MMNFVEQGGLKEAIRCGYKNWAFQGSHLTYIQEKIRASLWRSYKSYKANTFWQARSNYRGQQPAVLTIGALLKEQLDILSFSF